MHRMYYLSKKNIEYLKSKYPTISIGQALNKFIEDYSEVNRELTDHKTQNKNELKEMMSTITTKISDISIKIDTLIQNTSNIETQKPEEKKEIDKDQWIKDEVMRLVKSAIKVNIGFGNKHPGNMKMTLDTTIKKFIEKNNLNAEDVYNLPEYKNALVEEYEKLKKKTEEKYKMAII